MKWIELKKIQSSPNPRATDPTTVESSYDPEAEYIPVQSGHNIVGIVVAVAAECGGAAPVCGRPTPDAATEAAAICLPLLPGGCACPTFGR